MAIDAFSDIEKKCTPAFSRQYLELIVQQEKDGRSNENIFKNEEYLKSVKYRA